MKITLEVDEIRVVIEDGQPSLEVYDFASQDWSHEADGPEAAERLRVFLSFIEAHAKKAG